MITTTTTINPDDPKQIAQIKEHIRTVAQANELSTLLGIMAEKLMIKFDKNFWKNFATAYNQEQTKAKESRQFMDELTAFNERPTS